MAKNPGKAPANTGGDAILDFSQVKPFEPIDGKEIYDAVVEEAKRGVGPKGPKTSVVFSITGPEEVKAEEWVADDEAEGGMISTGEYKLDENGDVLMVKATNRKLFREYSHDPKALPFLYEFIKAVDPQAELGEGFKFNEKDYIGLPVRVKIKNEAYEEQIRPRVSKVLPA